MDLRDVLRQVDTDGHDILLHGLTPALGPTAVSLHSYAGAGAVQPITAILIHLSRKLVGNELGDIFDKGHYHT